MPSSKSIPPRIVGRYALYGEIGSGGMATVCFGKLLGSVGFSRPVAVKCLHPQFAKDPSFKRMFIDEARLASRIVHPNVVATLDAVESDGDLCLVMEYVPGESLARLRRTAAEQGEEIPLRVALAIVHAVLMGLHAAHEARSETGRALEIVHRDVSPQNVLVGLDGVPRVLDFGVARAAVRLESTQEGRIKGKLTYMAPEQLGGAEVTRRADVYSASVMLWELITGKRLFRGRDPHGVLVEKLFKGPVVRPSLHRAGLTEAIDALTRRGLERDPAHRFATAHEMALALELVGELASASEIARWVERTAFDAIAARASDVARWDSATVAIAARVGEGDEVEGPEHALLVGSEDASREGDARLRTPSAFVSPSRASFASTTGAIDLVHVKRRSAWLSFVGALAVGACAGWTLLWVATTWLAVEPDARVVGASPARPPTSGETVGCSFASQRAIDAGGHSPLVQCARR